MNIFDKIKKLKLIEPDASFAERSKRVILATLPPELPFRRVSVRQVLMHLLEAGVAGGLVALFLLLITGSVTQSPLSPTPFAAVSPTALHAEAQAVDIQIELAQLAYQAAQGKSAESTPVTAALPRASVTATSSLVVATSSASPSLSVDDVLKALTQ
jgi:hypothetical protein